MRAKPGARRCSTAASFSSMEPPRNGPGSTIKPAELFKRAIELDPADAAQAYNYLGFMWADQNIHLDEAEDYIKRALAAEPENGAYLDSLGWLHYRQGKYEQALAELLSAAAELKEEDPDRLRTYRRYLFDGEANGQGSGVLAEVARA